MIDFDNFCTVGNTIKYFTKQMQTVSLQPNYVSTLAGKTKNATKRRFLQCMRSVEPIVPDFRRKSFDVRFYAYLLENFFSSLLAENLSPMKNIEYNSLFSVWRPIFSAL